MIIEFFLMLTGAGIIIVAVWALSGWIHQIGVEEERRKQAFQLIRKGMSSQAVVEILGEGYTTSTLKDRTIKMEWKFPTRPVVKVTVYFKNNTAFAISSINTDTSFFYENETKEICN